MKLFRSILMLFILAAVAVGPVFADEVAELKDMVRELKADYESKIQALEAKIEQLESDQNNKMVQLKEEMEKKTVDAEYVGRHNAPVGDGGLLVENSFGFGNVSLGGYFDMEYRDRENEESTFRQHHWIINVGAQLAERLRFNSEFEIEYGGSNAEAGDGEARAEQAYADYMINDMVNLRAGAILSPFGRYNLYHDADLQDLTDRPLVARDVVPTTWTEAGAGLFGGFNPTIGSYEDLDLGYQIYAVNGLDNGFSDTGLGDARESLKTDNNGNKAIVGRLTISPFLGHELGVSGYTGAYDGNGDAITGIGFDTLDKAGPLELITEYAYFNVEETPTATSDVANFFQGAYAQLNYHFWPGFLNNTFLGRSFDRPTFTFVNRYDWALIHDDMDADSGNNKEDRYTMGLNYRPLDSFVVKIEYQFNDTKNEALEAGKNNGLVSSVALGF